MLERDLQRAIRKAIESRGGKVYKLHGSPYTVAGAPDLLGNLGKPFAIEVKLSGQVATMKQQHELREWSAQGWATGIAHSVEEALQIIEEPVQIVSRETFGEEAH